MNELKEMIFKYYEENEQKENKKDKNKIIKELAFQKEIPNDQLA